MASNAELLAQIAQLAGAINKHKIHAAGYPLVSRGRGRGKSYQTSYHRPAPTYYPNGVPAQQTFRHPAPSVNKKLVLNGPNKIASSDPSIAKSAKSAIIPSAPQPPKMTTGSHHKTLILNGVQPARPSSSTSKPVAGKRMSINGVAFVRDPSGRKLIREGVDISPSTPISGSSAKFVFTPKRLQVDGVEYVRTKSGNLVRAELVRKKLLEIAEKRKSASALTASRRDKHKNLVLGQSSAPSHSSSAAPKRSVYSKTGNLVLRNSTLTMLRSGGYSRRAGRGGLSIVRKSVKAKKSKKIVYCQFYCRYGKCTRGAACPYIHDPSRRFLCRRFLQGDCPLTASTCPLSHTPTPHTMATCQHFQRGSCRRGADCPYPHVRVNRDAHVCRAFALQGYCALGLECRERHVWCCPDFADTGKCTNVRCRLPHVGAKGKREEKGKSLAKGSKRKLSGNNMDINDGEDAGKRRKVGGEEQEDADGFLRFDNFNDDWNKDFGGGDDEEDEELMIVPDFTTDTASLEDEEEVVEEAEEEEEEEGEEDKEVANDEEEGEDGESDLESVDSDALDEESQRGDEEDDLSTERDKEKERISVRV